MASQTLRAIVLRHANYRDHDRMLTLFSPQLGRLEALSRGCRRPKSPLLPSAELFVQGEFVLFESGERNTVTGCAIADTYYPLRLDPYRLTCAGYLAALCLAAVQPKEPAPELFDALLNGLSLLAYQEEYPALTITTAFLLRFASLIGYRPRMNHCAHCRVPIDSAAGALLDVEAGGLVCAPCAQQLGYRRVAAYRLTGDQVAWMRLVLAQGLAAPAALSADAADLFIILRRYVESRLEGTIKVSKLLP